jgi:hypothetical protein
MNTSLTSLNTRLNPESNFVNDLESKEKLRVAQKCPSPNQSKELSAQGGLLALSISPAVSFLIGILIFFEDATRVSESFATLCFIVMIGMGNVGLAYIVFGAGHSRWDRYIYGKAWSVVLSMVDLALIEANCRRT